MNEELSRAMHGLLTRKSTAVEDAATAFFEERGRWPEWVWEADPEWVDGAFRFIVGVGDELPADIESGTVYRFGYLNEIAIDE